MYVGPEKSGENQALWFRDFSGHTFFFLGHGGGEIKVAQYRACTKRIAPKSQVGDSRIVEGING